MVCFLNPYESRKLTEIYMEALILGGIHGFYWFNTIHPIVPV